MRPSKLRRLGQATRLPVRLMSREQSAEILECELEVAKRQSETRNRTPELSYKRSALATEPGVLWRQRLCLQYSIGCVVHQRPGAG
jgi:hypothetical protein